MTHPTMTAYLVVGGIAALVTFIATPVVSRIALARGWVATPNDRSVHTAPMPTTGGMALLVGFFVAFIAAATIGGANLGLLFDGNTEPIGIVIALLIVFFTGWLDDVYELPSPAKVTLIVIAGMVLSWFGATMWYFRVPLSDILVLSGDIIPLATVLWLLGMTMAVNIIDGLDGLAAGIVGIGAFSFFLYSYRLSDLGALTEGNLGPLIAIITAGICVGFLPHNFNPATTFMGDEGALFLGALMAISTSLVGGRAAPDAQEQVGQTFFFFAPLVIPILILGVPIFDTVFAIVRRVSKRQAFDVADKGHLHHRLMNLGHGHRRSVLILWAWTALLSAFVLVPVLLNRNPAYVPFGVAALGIVLYTVLHPSVRRKRAEVVEDALDHPAFEQLAPDRPERREIDATNPFGSDRYTGDVVDPRCDDVADQDTGQLRRPAPSSVGSAPVDRATSVEGVGDGVDEDRDAFLVGNPTNPLGYDRDELRSQAVASTRDKRTANGSRTRRGV